MLSCTHCGRRVVASERHCTWCGRSLADGERSAGAGATMVPPRSTTGGTAGRSRRSSPCPHCTRPVDRDGVFCRHCGLPATPRALSRCGECGATPHEDDARFCGACGSSLVARPRPALETAPRGIPAFAGRARLALLDSAGDVTRFIPLADSPTIVGCPSSQLAPCDDPESQIELFPERDRVLVRALGAGSPMYLFINGTQRLDDGDVILVGSQVLRFRVLPSPREAPAARAHGGRGSTVPDVDVAVVEQLTDDGSVRDRHHLARGRTLLLGREDGEWVFPYDATMSGLHAEIGPHPDGGFFVRDVGSRNGVAVAMRGALDVASGSRLLLDGQMMRVELA